MTGRTCRAVELAVRLHLERGHSIAEAARRHGVALSSVRRALARAGVPPKPVGRPKGNPT